MSPTDPASSAVSAVLAAALDCVICIDDDGHVSEWNPAAERTFGWSRSEALGRDLSELIIPPELREAHRAGRERYRRTKEAHVLGRRVELPALRKDGTRLVVELTITEVQGASGPFFTAYLRDLTEQHRNETRRRAQYQVASLLAGAQRLEQIGVDLLRTMGSVGSWQFGAIWLATPEGTLAAAHAWQAEGASFPQFEAATRRLLIAPGEGFPGCVYVTGQPAWVSDVSADAAFLRRAEAASEGLHGAFGFPISGLGRTLGMFELLSTSRLSPDEDLLALSRAIGDNIGQFVQREWAMAALQTHVDEAQAQRRLANEQRLAAEAANAAKDRFIATLSHELRTPLTPMLLWSSSGFDDDPALPKHVRDGIRMIRANVELEARLIDDLLDFSRIAHGKLRLEKTVADIHTLLREVCRMLTPELAPRELEWEMRAQNARVTGDPIRLKQVLWNLLRNAAKFTPAGGKITIRTENTGPVLRVTIADTGAGIAPEFLEKIFAPFEQEPRQDSGGLGLGLSIARTVMAMHHGSLTASSEGPGRGATFELTLPWCAEENAAEIERAPQDALIAASWRILVVEDHPATLETLATLLRRSGHAVTTAVSLAKARQRIAEGTFELIVCDLGLPDGNGATLIRELPRARKPRAIALSGYGEEQDLKNSAEAGFDRHLTKPVDLAELETAIRELQQTS